MVNYGVPVWQLVIEAVKELNRPFSSAQVIKKIKEKNPNVKSDTIRCHVIGMTPTHPSSKYYPSLRENHAAFRYLGKGSYDIMENKQPRIGETKVTDIVDFEAPAWENITDKILDLENYILPFKVEFFDRETFKKFCDNLNSNLKNLKEICISGYFSETIRGELENLAQDNFHHVRIISPDFQVGTHRDKKNLEALRKLSKAGIEVKFNYRIHARLLVAYNSISALLLLGSFDYNTECIGKERYDAGIKTSHPDLAKSAIIFFEQVWNDSETQTLEQFLKDKKIAI
jgi:hypothetical protein